MITLKKPYIKKNKNKARLTFDFMIDKEEKSIWFEVDEEYEKYLCDDRIDAILIGLLNFALRNDHDIESDSYLTEDIYYKITNYLIPSLTKYDQSLHNINIKVKLKPAVKNAQKVGTGCSCGIDSMHAIFNHYKKDIKSYNITHLCINNVGAFNECYKEAGITKVKKTIINKSKQLAKELNLPIIVTDSNFQEEVYQKHNLTHAYSSTFAILCLQKLWKCYYYGSSGMDFTSFNLENNSTKDSCFYDLLSLDCFSTTNLKIYSEGGAKNRVEKTKDIYQNPLLRKYLHVCTTKEKNCTVCPKCMRTILTLYSLDDNMDNYKNIFDIDYFNEHKNEFFDWLYAEHCYNVEVTKPVYDACLQKEEFYSYIKDKEEQRLAWLESQKKENIIKAEYEKIVNSKSYKLGVALTSLPRRLKNILKKK